MSAYTGTRRSEDVIGAVGERSSLRWARRKIEEVKAGLRDDPGRAYSVEFTSAAEGALVRNGVVEVARPLSQLTSAGDGAGLASRIDRLQAEQKDLLQTLAVIGRESPLAVIMKVFPQPDGELDQMLSALQAGEFIYEQLAPTGVEYTFKHALTQEVAYNSLLIERRKLLHGRAGAAVEALYDGRLDDHLSELARHYQRSANVEKALEYLGRAGQQAIQRSSHAEAIALLSSALELLQALPETSECLERELALQLGLGSALRVAKGWSASEVGQAFARARELCRQIGETPHLFHGLAGLWGFYCVNGELETALDLAKQLLSIAQSWERCRPPTEGTPRHGTNAMVAGSVHTISVE